MVGEKRATLGLAVVCAAHFLIGADGLGVAIALPSMQRDLGVSALDVQWALTAYALAFGGVLLLGGRLGDLYGRRRLLVYGMVLFAAGALLAALAPALAVVIVARALQGLGAAAAVPAALALIGSLYPPGPERTRAVSLLATMASAGILSGLLLSGVITDLLGWRWVFGVLTVPALLAAAIAPRVLPEARAEAVGARADVGGAVLVSAGLMAILFGLTRVEHAGLGDLGTLGPLLGGVALLAGFVAWERRAREPLVRFEIFRVRSLRSASLGVGANSLGFTAIVFLGPLYLQHAQGYGALHAALALLPLDAVAIGLSVLAGGPLARWSPRAVLAGSSVLVVLSLLWLARAPVPANYAVDVLGPMVVLGAALPAIFIVTAHQAVADVAPDDKGLASGIFETASHLLGGAVGVAVYATALAAAGYGAGFLAAAGLVTVLGAASVLQARR